MKRANAAGGIQPASLEVPADGAARAGRVDASVYPEHLLSTFWAPAEHRRDHGLGAAYGSIGSYE